MTRLLLCAALGVIMQAVVRFAPAAVASGPACATLAAGYLLLTAFLAGSIVKDLGVPRLTGYLVAGLVVGPHASGLVSQDMVDHLRTLDGVAIALIALKAGVELDLAQMRPIARAIAWMLAAAVIGTAVLLAAALVVASPFVPFLRGLDPVQTVALSAVIATVLVVQSPAVVLALRDETAADGPLIRTVLGVVIASDFVLVILFALASTGARAAFGAGGALLETVRGLGVELLGSIVAGVVVGWFLANVVARIRESAGLVVVAACFLVAEVGGRLGLDPMLVALSAGITVRNATHRWGRVREVLEVASLPIYVTFFAVAGAKLDLARLSAVALPAAALAVLRGIGFQVGTRFAARRVGAGDALRRYGGVGLLPQAGLALVLVNLATRTFPPLGSSAYALVMGVVALDQLITPVLFRIALGRSGEVPGATAADYPATTSRGVAPSAGAANER